MKILAFELSTARGSLAWLTSRMQPTPAAAREGVCDPRNEEAELVREWPNDRKNSGMFFEYLADVRQEFGLPDAIVVGLGPGSYAGTRIAIATAVGLRAASGARLTGIPSICGIETAARQYCVIGDARRESFFLGRVSNCRVVEGPSLHSREELETKMMEENGPLFAFEALPQFPQAILAYPSARRLAELARDRIGEIADTRSLEPIYLREPHITVPKAFPRTAIHR